MNNRYVSARGGPAAMLLKNGGILLKAIDLVRTCVLKSCVYKACVRSYVLWALYMKTIARCQCEGHTACMNRL